MPRRDPNLRHTVQEWSTGRVTSEPLACPDWLGRSHHRPIDPFDNDTAADWCGDLHDADPSARSAMVRAALTTAALNTGYLEHDEAVSAIAAAAIVASHMPGGDPITSPCAPDFLLAAIHLRMTPECSCTLEDRSRLT
ncbi:DUF4259 domain-containing protein [Micromonospora sp. NBC_01740]|uniref:DUF4259 domain-containing protein n=1 Tax=Micromonospora sp. NBC_01740 TaxID=2975986 RepID=UPI002E1186E4|nr:DUF4259 domain-containing protein [Micromonospora sp. NBC_01740]